MGPSRPVLWPSSRLGGRRNKSAPEPLSPLSFAITATMATAGRCLLLRQAGVRAHLLPSPQLGRRLQAAPLARRSPRCAATESEKAAVLQPQPAAVGAPPRQQPGSGGNGAPAGGEHHDRLLEVFGTGAEAHIVVSCRGTVGADGLHAHLLQRPARQRLAGGAAGSAACPLSIRGGAGT